MVYYVAYVCSDCLLHCVQASLGVVSSACYDGFILEFGDVGCDDSCSGCCVYGAPSSVRAVGGGR